ncbi:factor 1 [Branchiostoma belcheri]|nr:factor 1 [Branchiostoma belcheri]
MAIPGSLEKRQRLTDDSGDQTSLTDLLHTCIKETRELDSQTESAVLGLHDHTGKRKRLIRQQMPHFYKLICSSCDGDISVETPEAQSPKSGFPGGWTAVKIDLTLSKLDVLPEASQVMASRPVRFISGPGQSVICPYNDAHIVQSNRLLRHILKYRKNYTGPDLAVCRHRAVHIMSPAEIQQHEATCPYGKGYSAVHIMSPAEIEQHEATCPYAWVSDLERQAKAGFITANQDHQAITDDQCVRTF